MLPAIQSAREAARRTQCKNQLRQLAISFHNHHDTHKFFPSGGWGWFWVGFPEQGYGKSQSGGWLYSLLPYMEETTLHDLGSGLTGQARRDAAKKRVESPFEGMTCPSRRRANVYEFDSQQSFRYCEVPIDLASKTDYAANAGTMLTPEINNNGGPSENGDNLLAIKAPIQNETAARRHERKLERHRILLFRSRHAAGSRRHVEDVHGRREMVVLRELRIRPRHRRHRTGIHRLQHRHAPRDQFRVSARSRHRATAAKNSIRRKTASGI